MASMLDIIERKVAELEKLVFKEDFKIPEPDVLEDDKINPEMIKYIDNLGLKGFYAARRVPSDYYENPLEYRRDCLKTKSTEQLTKCFIFEIQEPRKEEERFVLVNIQYIDSIDNKKLEAAVSKLLGYHVIVSGAKEEDASGLSGAGHNGMTPAFMNPKPEYKKYKVPIILSQKIAALDPPFFWMGGTEVDVKLGMDTRKFIEKYHPVIEDISP